MSYLSVVDNAHVVPAFVGTLLGLGYAKPLTLREGVLIMLGGFATGVFGTPAVIAYFNLPKEVGILVAFVFGIIGPTLLTSLRKRASNLDWYALLDRSKRTNIQGGKDDDGS